MPNRPIDATMLSSYAKCPRHYYYRHVQHWSQKGDPNSPIAFGTAWHAAMDVAWPMIFAGGEASKIHAAAFLVFAENYYLVATPPYDHDTAYRLLGAYIEKALAERAAEYGSIWNGGLLGVELPFVIPLMVDGETYDYCGVIDKVVSMNKAIIPVDHKTTSKYSTLGGFRTDFRSQWSPRGQFIGYAYACSLLYNARVPHVLVDAQLVHKKENISEFLPVTITDTEIAEWMDDVAHTIRRMRMAESGGAYEKLGPMNDACHAPYECAYKPLCHGDFPWKSGQMPIGLYEERKWEPVGGEDATKSKV